MAGIARILIRTSFTKRVALLALRYIHVIIIRISTNTFIVF